MIGSSSPFPRILAISVACVSAISLHKQVDEAGNCTCVGYQDAWNAHETSCSVMNDESMCENFMKRMSNENFCLKLFGAIDSDKNEKPWWCYVDSKCKDAKDLKWGSSKDLAWKVCDKANGDKFGYEIPFEELFEISTIQDIDLITLLRWAYPFKLHTYLQSIMGHYGLDEVRDINGTLRMKSSPVTNKTARMLKRYADSKKHALIMHGYNQPPFAVIGGGKQLFWTNYAPWLLDYTMESRSNKPTDHLASMTDSACVANCRQETAPTWWHNFNQFLPPQWKDGKSCDCIPWADAFTSGNHSCDSLGHFECQDFLHRLTNDDQFCLNGEHSEDFWCFTSDACESAKNGPLGVVRTCPSEKNLREKSLMELVEWSHERNIDVGQALHWAYELPHVEIGLEEVMHYYNITELKDSEGATHMQSQPPSPKAKKWLDNKDPDETYYVSYMKNRPPYIVIEGDRAYWVNYGLKLGWFLLIEKGTYGRSQPGTRNNVTCIHGCEEFANTTQPPIMWSIINGKKAEPLYRRRSRNVLF